MMVVVELMLLEMVSFNKNGRGFKWVFSSEIVSIGVNVR